MVHQVEMAQRKKTAGDIWMDYHSEGGTN